MLDAGGERFTRAATCPLCFNPVSARDLRLVHIRSIPPLPRIETFDSISFTLLRRPRNSIMPHCAIRSQVVTDSSAYAPLAADPFAKFVVAKDPQPVFRKAAVEIARYTASLVATGGVEAEVEGPSAFKSMDVLAECARSWALHRAEAASIGHGVSVEGAAGPDDSTTMADAAAAEQAVRDVFEAELADERTRAARAVENERRAREAAEHEAHRAVVFPLLSSSADVSRGFRAGGVWERGGDSGEWEGVSPDREGSPRNADDDMHGLQFALDACGLAETPPLRENVSWRDGLGMGTMGDEVRPSPDEGIGCPGSMEDSVSLLGKSPNQNLSVNRTSEGDFWLYQSADGQWVFLHPVNVRCDWISTAPACVHRDGVCHFACSSPRRASSCSLCDVGESFGRIS
jgi:hypothetical protein